MKMSKTELLSGDNDKLRMIKENADDMAHLLRGLESTARVVHILGTAENLLQIENEDVAHMMASFREQLSTIRDSVEGISDLANEALIEQRKKGKAVNSLKDLSIRR